MKLQTIDTIRTNNFQDESLMENIHNLWKKASKQLEQQSYNSNVYGVYHNYESNYKGDYSLSIAIEFELGNLVIPEHAIYHIFKVDSKDS